MRQLPQYRKQLLRQVLRKQQPKSSQKLSIKLQRFYQVLAETAKISVSNILQQKDGGLLVKQSVDVKDIPLNTKFDQHNQPLRLDTITSQSEVDSSDTDN